MTPQEFKDYLQIFLQLANIVIIGYGLYKFLNKPHDTLVTKHEALEKRVDAHDSKFKEVDLRFKNVEDSLHHGNDKFREQKGVNEVFINCMLAFIDFEMAYCAHTGYEYTEDLIKAKEALQKHLASK